MLSNIHLMTIHNNIINKSTKLFITETNHLNIFSEPYSNKFFVIGELNWKDVVNNPLNELSEDDENYVCLYDSSYTDDDNHDYDENVDMDPLFEKQMNYLMSTGLITHTTTSDNSNESEKCKTSSATLEKQSLSKYIIN